MQFVHRQEEGLRRGSDTNAEELQISRNCYLGMHFRETADVLLKAFYAMHTHTTLYNIDILFYDDAPWIIWFLAVLDAFDPAFHSLC